MSSIQQYALCYMKFRNNKLIFDFYVEIFETKHQITLKNRKVTITNKFDEIRSFLMLEAKYNV